MTYIENYFGKKKIDEITYEDVVSFFSEDKEESDKIEFKSFVNKDVSSDKDEHLNQKIKGVIRSVSGFLNSEGGLLIWGAPKGEESKGKKEKVFNGELSMVEELFEKDQLISKLTDSITPSPKGILYHRIEHDGKYIYLLEVFKSNYSPHQFDNRFYMRIDGQTKPAPYHYIEALFKQIKFPNINGYIKLEDWSLDNTSQRSRYHLNFKVFIFNHSKLQNDYNVSYRIVCSVGKFQSWDGHYQDEGVSYEMGGHEKRVVNFKDVIHYGEPIYHNECVVFDAQELSRVSGQVEIVLVFGAKKSPMKICTYKLQINQQAPADLNDWFIEINENQMMSEGIDVTEEDKLKGFLDRDANV